MSATPKKIAQPRNSQPSTLMPLLPHASSYNSMLCSNPIRPDPDRLALFWVAPGPDFRVVQIERGPLRPDARNRGEVVPRRRAGGRPLERVRPAPGVVDFDLLAVLPRDVDVVEEDQVGHAEYERANRRDLVQRRREVRQERVVRRPPRLAH